MANIDRSSQDQIIPKVQIDPVLLQELVVGDVRYRSAGEFHITAADLEKARKELKELDEVRQTSLENLREMLVKDENIRYRMDDDYLLRFLRYRKFDCKQAYKSIRKLYTMRNDDPQLFTVPPDIHLKLEGEFINMMPYAKEDGVLLFIHKFGHWNSDKMSVRDLANAFSYVSDVMTMNPHTQIDGIIDIWDFKGLSAKQASVFMHPSAVRLWTTFVQDVYPWRIKKAVLFNCNTYIYASLSFVRLFLKKKFQEKLVFLRSDVEELHKHINPALLPKEFGGHLDNDECYSYLRKVILSNRDYLDYENSFIGYRK